MTKAQAIKARSVACKDMKKERECEMLPHRQMETTLLHFVFHPAAALATQVVEHLREHLFQTHIGHGVLLRVGLIVLLHSQEAIVGNIDSCAIHVATVLCGVAIVATHALHFLFRTHHTGDDNLASRQALNLQTIKEVTTDILK